MNIDKIVKKCPRAWEECSKFLRFDGFELLGFVNKNFVIKMKDREIRERVFYRELFDYFDSVGIEVIIRWMSDGWHYEIGTDEQFKVAFSKQGFETRTEAEYEAFERAFEIREKQIEDGE